MSLVDCLINKGIMMDGNKEEFVFNMVVFLIYDVGDELGYVGEWKFLIILEDVVVGYKEIEVGDWW